ncbi:MAG: acyl-ACP--UDP-N-acetylglucosamine O-acyltransferase [Pseudomonadota bacterium]|nr:acyl-ACP--UDP-N-acetylglucosamine O-acyltransferase [Pseudomonadota bacterium]
MAFSVHPTAVVDPAARIAEGCAIGPYCVVGPHVELGQDVILKSHVVVEGHTSIGAGTVVWPFASLGGAPQDLKYRGEASRLVIGKNNRIREYVTMNTGTEGGGMETRVGDNGLFMAGVHVAHDCRVGNSAVLANNVGLAGHVEVGDNVVIGALAGVHQFVRIGSHAMIGGMSAVDADIIPYGLVKGDRAFLAGLNLVGLERRGFPKDGINDLRTAFRALFGQDKTMVERMESVRASHGSNPLVQTLLAFMAERTSRAMTMPRG